MVPRGLECNLKLFFSKPRLWNLKKEHIRTALRFWTSVRSHFGSTSSYLAGAGPLVSRAVHGLKAPLEAMGTAQARQQALQTGSSLGGSMGGAQTLPSGSAAAVGVPVADATAASTAVAEGGQDDLIPVVFTWTHGGQNVYLAASFNGWREQIPMVRSGNEFAVVKDLPRGMHQYKFVVDDHWRFAPDQPKTQDYCLYLYSSSSSSYYYYDDDYYIVVYIMCYTKDYY